MKTSDTEEDLKWLENLNLVLAAAVKNAREGEKQNPGRYGSLLIAVQHAARHGQDAWRDVLFSNDGSGSPPAPQPSQREETERDPKFPWGDEVPPGLAI